MTRTTERRMTSQIYAASFQIPAETRTSANGEDKVIRYEIHLVDASSRKKNKPLLCGIERDEAGKNVAAMRLSRREICPRCMQQYAKKELQISGRPEFGGAIKLPAETQKKYDQMTEQAVEGEQALKRPADFDADRLAALSKRFGRQRLSFQQRGDKYALFGLSSGPAWFGTLNAAESYYLRHYDDPEIPKDERDRQRRALDAEMRAGADQVDDQVDREFISAEQNADDHYQVDADRYDAGYLLESDDGIDF